MKLVISSVALTGLLSRTRTPCRAPKKVQSVPHTSGRKRKEIFPIFPSLACLVAVAEGDNEEIGHPSDHLIISTGRIPWDCIRIGFPYSDGLFGIEGACIQWTLIASDLMSIVQSPRMTTSCVPFHICALPLSTHLVSAIHTPAITKSCERALVHHPRSSEASPSPP